MTVMVRVLGTAQDGGVPQIGCSCDNCTAARMDPSRRRRVSSIGVVNLGTGRSYLLDATWDLPDQLQVLGRISGRPLPDAILLTHAHIGHYAGLLYLGKEILATRGLPVYGTPSMADFLRSNLPWRNLIDHGNIVVHTIAGGDRVELDRDVTVKPLSVPHRNEHSDTVAYWVQGGKRLLYLPDLDRWDGFEDAFNDIMQVTDYALIDGTFLSTGELEERRGRSLREVPHPTVQETLGLFQRGILTDGGADVSFTHFNHTNPLLDPDSNSRDRVTDAGFGLAVDGQILQL